jgi:PKD repeat protein
MKNKFHYLITMMLCILSFIVHAQNPPCNVKPMFKFNADKCAVYFIDSSITIPKYTITNWYWNFGDATNSTLQNPTHFYSNPGLYNVCLTTVAKDSSGQQCKNHYCYPVKVQSCGSTAFCKLAARFDFRKDKCNVSFSDVSAVGAGTTITNWYWDFGDATTSTLQKPTHAYAAAGTYTVCLIVVGTNAAGQKCKDQFCEKVTIDDCGQIEPCKLAAKYAFKTQKCNVSFTDQSKIEPGTTITNFHWNFGDSATSTLPNPTHTYMTAGTYDVCLTIIGTNAKGQQCKNQFCQKVTVEGCGQVGPCKLAAKFAFKTDKCNAWFTDQSMTNPGATIKNWYWDFGDATTSTLKMPTHTYATAGTYNVCLTIISINKNGERCKDKFCEKVIVEGCGQVDPCKLETKFDLKTDSCKASFVDYSSTDTGTSITSWHWDFGDATTSALQNPTHVYTTSGTYKACLTIEGLHASGIKCKDQMCSFVDIKSCGPDTANCGLHAQFSSKTDSCTATFTNTSTVGVGNTITRYHWTFGDGDSSNIKTPTHVYARSGFYLACLTIESVNAAGIKCQDSKCHPLYIDGCDKDPIECNILAGFEYKNDSTSYTFDNYSLAGFETTIIGQKWTFGDGESSFVGNPTHVYAKPGKYMVCLVVTGKNIAMDATCEDKKCRLVDTKDNKRTIATNENSSFMELYPNPAKDVVNINYKMAAAGQVNITITNIQGKILAVVQDGYQAAGDHSLTWNADIPQGWYLISIKTDAGIEQKQLIIQK